MCDPVLQVAATESQATYVRSCFTRQAGDSIKTPGMFATCDAKHICVAGHSWAPNDHQLYIHVTACQQAEQLAFFNSLTYRGWDTSDSLPKASSSFGSLQVITCCLPNKLACRDVSQQAGLQGSCCFMLTTLSGPCAAATHGSLTAVAKGCTHARAVPLEKRLRPLSPMMRRSLGVQHKCLAPSLTIACVA